MSREQQHEADEQAGALDRARPGALDRLQQHHQQHEPPLLRRTTPVAPDAVAAAHGDGAVWSRAQQQQQQQRDRTGPIRYFYAFYFSSLAAFVPFVSLYLRDSSPARLTAAQVGAVAALRPLVSAPAGVLLAALADRRGWHRPLLVAGHALSAAARAALVLLSGTLAGVVAITVASEALGAPVCVIADATAVAAGGGGGYGALRLWGALGWGLTSLLSGTVLQRGGMGASAAAYLLLAVPALWAAARMPCDLVRKKEVVASAAAAAAATTGVGSGDEGEELGEHDQVEDGDDGGGKGKGKGARAAAARAAASAAASPRRRPEAAPPLAPPPSSVRPLAPPPSSVLALLRRDLGAVLFLATACLFGVGVGGIGEFLFLHLRDSLAAPEWLMGATLAVTCAAEVPAFRLQPRLLRAIGVRAVLRLVAAAYVLRTALYALLPAAARLLPAGLRSRAYFLVLPVEMLHGLCFACAWATGTAHCRRAAPRGCEAELQAWFSGCFFGAGQATGCLVAGLLYARLGGAGMFGALSGMLGLGFAALEVLGARWPWAVLVRQGGSGGDGGGGEFGGGGGVVGGVARTAAGARGSGEEEDEQPPDDDAAGEGAWQLEVSDRARARWRAVFRGGGGGGGRSAAAAAAAGAAGEGRRPAQSYRKLEHKNSDAEMAIVGGGGGSVSR